MNWITLKMLMGDRTKYFGIVFGVAFAALLIAHRLARVAAQPSCVERTGVFLT